MTISFRVGHKAFLTESRLLVFTLLDIHEYDYAATFSFPELKLT